VSNFSTKRQGITANVAEDPERGTLGSLRAFLLGAPALRAVIERVAISRQLASGTVLFRKDDESDTFYLIDEGQIEISVMSSGGRKLSLDILTAPELFGEIGLFAGRRTADATAITPVVLRSVRRSDLLSSIRTDPDLALSLIDLLCARLKAVSDKLEARTFQSLPTRLASRVLQLLDTYSTLGGTVPLSQTELADFMGATREAVAKTLASWRESGWIEISRGAIHIRDLKALQAVADEGA
jgi:CRP/FNR family cyclic AMP-dependent transcriptional regulator